MKGFAQEIVHEVVRDGRAELHALARFDKAHQTPWQPITVLQGVVFPVLLFMWVYFCFCFGLRFYHPVLSMLLGPILGFVVCAGAAARARSLLKSSSVWAEPARAALLGPKERKAAPARGPLALAVSLSLALAISMLGGEMNYQWHLASYYEFQDLAAYTDIDPMADKGQSYMDAGQMYFREYSKVDVEQMVVYRSHRVYCAAPILVTPVTNQDGKQDVERAGHFQLPQSSTVDFWAIGMDCCDQETRSFTCGAVGDSRARAGIRLLRDDVRPFYTLAVQEWEARLCPLDDNTLQGRSQASPLICPRARHPLFFHWVVDPLLEVDNFFEKGSSMFNLHIVLFFFGNTGLTLAMLWGFLLLGVR